MPIKNTTREMLSWMPQWMHFRVNEHGTGAQLMDVAGTQFYDIDLLIETILFSGFVQTVEPRNDFDLLGIDYLYKLDITSAMTDQEDLYVKARFEDNVVTDTILDRATSPYDFYKPGTDKYYFDYEEYALYFKVKPVFISVNGVYFEELDIIKTHIWGPLDEIGLLIGCPRIKNEVNLNYKGRLMDVFLNMGGPSKKGLTGYISRSLDVYPREIEINSLHDEDYMASLINEDGTLSKQLKEYIEISNRINNISLNNYWEIIDEIGKGVKYLPIVWDRGLYNWYDTDIQNGIGDGNDLLVTKPEIQPSKQDFTYALYAEGLNYPDKKIFPEHNFKYKVYAEGYAYENGYQPEAYKYKVSASELIPLEFTVKAYKLYKHYYDVDFKDLVVPSSGNLGINNQSKYLATSNVIIRNGQYCSNKMKRYFQVAANLYSSSDRLSSPILQDLSIKYTKGGVAKTIVIKKEELGTWVNNKINVGWELSTWTDTHPDIRIRLDTNDSYNTDPNKDSDLMLVKGDYRKIYNSRGDWEDGMDNEASLNIRITDRERGTLIINI